VEVTVTREPREAQAVATMADVPAEQSAGGEARIFALIPPSADSPLSLSLVQLDAGSSWTLGGERSRGDVVVVVVEGTGTCTVGDADLPVGPVTAVRVGVDEEVRLIAGGDTLLAALFATGPDADVHAPLGAATRTVTVDLSDAEAATSGREYQVLFGAANGSLRSTVFLGVVPPGAAPWHFHQYDEIIYILEGRTRFHQVGGVQDMPTGAAVRVLSRMVHINENPGSDDVLVLGAFTPAGSPAAAYLARVGDDGAPTSGRR
jgi:quercetin dioxygenase-like cupin family protein